ncbi:MAG: hypothetical protein ACTSUO_07140 [Candidatus Thorarchaeota archaeon]
MKGIDTDTKRAIYESMTNDREALRLLSIGVVQAISSLVQLPCEDPSPF